ncbi:hypothetical protein, partial [Methylomonas methanica]|uniref:hypothetical protein n=2 Tax=Methylococcaceae TaxID=403 RepID=UPI0018D42767
MAARRASEEDIDDDLERESRSRHAARIVGAWMHPYVAVLASQIESIDLALKNLGLDKQPVVTAKPRSDARFERLVELINKELRTSGQWNRAERLIIFTEYKTTLDYLANRLASEYGNEDGAILQLYGGMNDDDLAPIS